MRKGRFDEHDNQLVDEIKKNAKSILMMDNIENFINYSDQFGKLCKNKRISTSQIRAIFQKVKRLPDNYETSRNDLNLLRPKLAYQTGRYSQLRPLKEIIDTLIKEINNDETLKGFKEFFEAIIAYHKSYGGD